MICIRDIHNYKLLNIVFPQCRKNAFLEQIIVRNYVADILRTTIYSSLFLQQEDKFNKPFSTSLISPGGDCKRKFEAAWIRSVASMIEWLLKPCDRYGLVASAITEQQLHLLDVYMRYYQFIVSQLFDHRFTNQSLAVNCDSVTPAPIAAVDDTPPVTVLIRLSA